MINDPREQILSLRWVSVNDKMPEQRNDFYLVTDEDRLQIYSAYYSCGYRDEWKFVLTGLLDWEIKYWMSFPEKPIYPELV